MTLKSKSKSFKLYKNYNELIESVFNSKKIQTLQNNNCRNNFSDCFKPTVFSEIAKTLEKQIANLHIPYSLYQEYKHYFHYTLEFQEQDYEDFFYSADAKKYSKLFNVEFFTFKRFKETMRNYLLSEIRFLKNRPGMKDIPELSLDLENALFNDFYIWEDSDPMYGYFRFYVDF